MTVGDALPLPSMEETAVLMGMCGDGTVVRMMPPRIFNFPSLLPLYKYPTLQIHFLPFLKQFSWIAACGVRAIFLPATAELSYLHS